MAEPEMSVRDALMVIWVNANDDPARFMSVLFDWHNQKVREAVAAEREACALAAIEYDREWGRGDRYGEAVAKFIRTGEV